MRLLLDTHIALWAAEGAPQLSIEAARLIEDPANTLLVSAAAIWEIAIKHAKGNLKLHPRDARTAFRLAGFTELSISGEHAEAVSQLPLHADHADPFDRLMVTQALVEGIPLLSADPKVWRYHDTLMMRA
ncbi:type II toxin-antitoxin system VapC family toxin [Trinickia violacea]|uniref:Type II toxin-antitoxin system VapC family toxin n=1 Tax=Trinickia violacea TaxID=2571746 RepID=A0A4V1EIG7_9BURK|nr:type II toxin-antitoxin system VapC family toxin [Trinickia violacea]QCP53710.1 type II toxin-antitoxin system VapC family toxin [Trinickia violacea]